MTNRTPLLATLALLAGLIAGGCAGLSGPERTSIAITQDNRLVCKIVDVPCLIHTNRASVIPHLTPAQWTTVTNILVRDTNSAWQVESRELNFELRPRKVTP